MPNKIAKPLMFLVIFPFFFKQGFSQISITGPTCVQAGTSYQYTIAGNWTGSTSMTWNITGGVITGTTNTSTSGTPKPNIYITWSSSGNVKLTTSNPTGNATLNVSVSSALSGGSLSNTSQTITYNTTPSGINSASGASGGNCSPVYSYQWQQSSDNVNFSDISGQTGLNLSFSLSLTATTYYRRKVTEAGSGSVAYSNTATVTVMPQLFPNTVMPGSQDIFSGNTATNLAIPPASGGNCSGSYTYSWEYSYDNSVFYASGLGSANSLSPGSPTSTIYYRRKVVCGIETAYSNAAAIYVHNHLSISSISPGPATITYNTSPSILSATASGGICVSYSYQWLQSSNNINWTSIGGATANTYNPGNLTSTTYFQLQAVCASETVYTPSVTITVMPPLQPGTLGGVSGSIGYNTSPGNLTIGGVTGGNCGGAYSYQWQKSTDNVNFNNISGVNASSYNPGNLTSTTYYRVLVSCGSESGSTNTLAVSVDPPVTCSISPSAQTIVNGTAAADLNPTVGGGNGSYTYQWQNSPDNTNWTNIATTMSYSPGTLTATKYFRLIVTSNGASTTSNTATVTVIPPPSSVLSISSTTRSGDGSINTLSCVASGGNGTYTYAWYSSTDGGNTYQSVSASGASFTTGVITTTTLFYVAVTSASSTNNSNVVSITMPSAPVISANSTVLCNGATATLSATGGSGNFTWYNSVDINVGNGPTYSTATAGTYYAKSDNTYGTSGKSNIITVSTSNTPVAAPILGNTNCVLGSTAQLVNATPGGTWSSNNTGIAKIDAEGVVTGVSAGVATVTYAVTNACGSSSQQLGITVVPFSSYSVCIGTGIANMVITDTISLAANAVKTTQVRQDTIYSSAHTIQNVIAFRVVEEAPNFIPGDFTATVVVKIEYGHTSSDIYQVDSANLTVNYSKNQGNKYDALNYFTFNNAEFTRVTVLRVEAPMTVNSVSFDTKQVLLLTNSLVGTRYYQLADNKKPVLSYINPPAGPVPDALGVSWVYPDHTNNNYTQLEWTWLENEMSGAYLNGGVFDTSLLFKNGATRIDMPDGAGAGGYTIPLLYGGAGKLFIRARGVTIMPSGSRSDGPWSGVQTFAFNGHNDSLNWQWTTSFAEEGKRKTVVQYYDGSLRSRQTVTKDNGTLTTVVAETLYDGQGRPAVQILPVPGISNIIAYTKNLNKFYNQPDNSNPLDYFDFTTVSLGNYATAPLSQNSGTALYYSNQNPELNSAPYNKNIPSTSGFAYAVTRYTPDGTGRIMMQGGVGDSLQIGGSHATRYYYGTPAQEELDALFGTEVGNYTHYFKNMVKDANGQMSVSYVDMYGRTIATALAGQSPTALQALNIADNTQYKNQAGKVMTRNLLDKGSNVLKGNSIESVNSLLVPFNTLYNFNYQLPRQILQLPTCSGGTVSYNCKFDLQVSISDESGDSSAIAFNYPGIDSINFQYSTVLQSGSYSVRKTLIINQDSLSAFLQQYNTLNVGLCQTQQSLIDSIAAADSTTSGCGTAPVPLTCSSCLAALGIYATYLSAYAGSIGISDTTLLSAMQKADIRNQYLSDSSFCASLNMNISRTLDNIRKQMLADLVPYSGQYALDTDTTSMAKKYNIFSTNGTPPLYTQPYYKIPRNRSGDPDNYYDAFGRIDSVTTKVGTMSMNDFEQAFAPSWTNSLLSYHPEFRKLKFAQDNLQTTYDFIDSINQTVSTAFNLIASDPFFTSVSAGADKDTITKFSNTAWQGNYSMWQIAYGDAFGCKTIADTSRNTCYSNMPKQFTTTGTVVNTGAGNVTLSASIQSQAWSMYLGFYSQVRGDMVNAYIGSHADSTYTKYGDVQNLINQGFTIYFPYNNAQQAQNYPGWSSWYPNQAGTYPTVSPIDTVKAYNTPCNGYINAWRLALLQCPALAGRDSASREQIGASITGKMLQVCQYGTDGANPYGSSTVAPAWSGAAYTSFEQAVNAVLVDSLHIPKDQYCNPYGIEYPKPYGMNVVVTKKLVTSLDTCTCSQFAKLKTEVIAAEYSAASLSSINQYLWLTYKDTLTPALYQGLQQCAQPYLYHCRRDSFMNKCGPGTFYDSITGVCYSYYAHCDSLYQWPLPSPQPLPVFLTCGFSKSSYNCYDCNSFKILDSSFYAIFGRRPVFSGTTANDTVIAYNNLFAQYLNFKTGLQHNWQYYAEKFNLTGCAVGGISGTGSGLSICLDKTPLNDTAGLVQPQPPCQQVRNQAMVKAALVYEALQQQLIANFKAAYLAKCLSSNESFKVTDTIKEYHYTLYYYDQAGNLVKTVPPKGVNPIYRQSWIDSVEVAKLSGTVLVPAHGLATRYCYNSLNQVNIQNTPDAGTGRFWYDRLGRLAVSQNAKQVAGGGQYSYTLYDALGRITEVGQMTSGTAITDVTAKNDSSLQAWQNNAANTRNQVTQTEYDTAYVPVVTGLALGQRNLRNRVSYTQVINNAGDAWPAGATYYTYDIQGNVDTLLQDFGNSSGIANAMNQSGNRFKKIVYDYDLVSGKVNQVSYQPGQPDAYYHRYVYDAENRITDTYSGRDSAMLFLFPEREAHYSYYKHGPLARTEMGQLRVQGLDYAYTLQGWLKGVNPAMGGTLGNGTDTTQPFPAAQNAYGFSLHYYHGDYKAIGYALQATSIIGALGSSAAPLYNGNIAAMAVNIPKLGSTKLYNYHYDQLNRLVAMDAYNGLNPVTGTFTPLSISDYQERVSYDPNGNILTYLKNGDAARLSMDNLSYFYKTNTNQLHKVTDAAADASAGTYSQYNDIKQGQTDNNYRYDAIGNLTGDASEGIANISWSVYGKITDITKPGTQIKYVYDAAGNRIMKQTPSDTMVYVREAGGNVMSVYSKPAGGTLAQTEVHLYGSSRLGMVTQHLAKDTSFPLMGGFGYVTGSIFTRGEKLFELPNHLGNVLATVSDRRIQNSAGGVTVDYYTADVQSANDYYPFGMSMPGRTLSLANGYRYGFNGKELDNQSPVQYDYGFRIYDPRLGRFKSVDPLAHKMPAWSPYAAMADDPLNKIDPDGQEPIKPLVGSVATFMRVFNNTPSRIGLTQGAAAGQALLRLASTEFSWKQMRPLPITTPYFNNKEGRYIYTEKGGWIDMVHFLFYAGKGYEYKQQKESAQNAIKEMEKAGAFASQGISPSLIKQANMDPVGKAVQDGYSQEMTDRFAAKYSAYSYEDLPTDKFAADFGANYFNPNSKLTLGEQIKIYLNDKLKATDPSKAPNYNQLPTKEPTDKPSRTNHTTKPVYTADNP